jgi:hypothetical protein
MDVIVKALKEQENYEELLRLWHGWESDLKSYLFLDLAIVHKCKEGVKLIGDLMGAEIYLTPYDEHQRVTPLYIAHLLSKTHKDYEEIAKYMQDRIDSKSIWNRRKAFCWLLDNKKAPKLPSSLLKHMVTEFM